MPPGRTDEAGRLAASWVGNADVWTRAVRDGAIPSRRAGTDAAVVEAVLTGLPPGGRVLDVGCGEGWLCRALDALGARAHGVDASAPLVGAARAAGGSFDVVSYAEAADEPGRLGGPYDAAVFNFALLSDDAIGVLRAAARQLAPGGRVVVQTVHPLAAGPPYRDGWREETFAAFGDGFEPMPWYFRTLGSWVRVVDAAGLRITALAEPQPEGAELPLSLVLTAEPLAEAF